MPYIGLLDCNNFFVSCERLFRPDLLGKPVVVLSNNDGCIVARSQEVKDLAIPMGVPYFQVKDVLTAHKATVFSGNFPLYRDISHRIFSLLKKEVDLCERYSIDEAFFTCTDNDPLATATALKEKVERQVGIPVSIGLAKTKTQAKYANSQAKSLGKAVFLDNDAFAKESKQIALNQIWGVGVGRVRQFKAKGIETVADLLHLDIGTVQTLFGVEGVRLYHELRGEAIHQVKITGSQAKSHTSSRAFGAPLSDLASIKNALAYHVRRVAESMRKEGQLAVSIQVDLLAAKGQSGPLRNFRKTTLAYPSNDTSSLLKVAYENLTGIYQKGVRYRKTGCVVACGMASGHDQPTLFSNTNEVLNTRNKVWSTVDTVNKRYGIDTLSIGSVRTAETWRSKAEHKSKHYTTAWSELPTAST